MAFVKHFCRLLTHVELDDEDVITFYDIVQSVVPTKIVTAYSDDSGEQISVEVIAYTDYNDSADRLEYLYEIILEQEINLEEGDQISAELDKEFDFDFDFEASVEI